MSPMSDDLEHVPEHARTQLLDRYPVLQYFVYSHLPPHLQAASKPFADLAWSMAVSAVDQAALDLGPHAPCVRQHPELAEGLRKLLEGKDCFVRSYMALRPRT